MPKVAKRLSDKQVENAKPKNKNYKLCDGEGLYLLVRKSGSKVWQYPYKHNGKRTVFTIGSYHKKGQPGHVSLQDARYKRHEVRSMLDESVDPNEHKSAQREAADQETTFEALGREWHSKGVWSPKHAKHVLKSLEADAFPIIGSKQITEITRQDIVIVLEKVEARGAYDVAKRICQRCEAVFDYALGKGLCEDNPAAGRARFIKTPKRQNRPHLKENQVGEFLSKLDDYHGKDYVRLGMKMLAYTFVRPGELRNARWDEIDFQKSLWSIPAERMKMDREHWVFLSDQVLAILEELRPITGKSDFLFPGIRSPHKPISDVTLLKLVKILGYEGEKKIVPHGFRHTASTILNEYRFDYDVIERQLAHVQKNSVRRAYNHAEYEPQRRKMMQWYADHLDGLKATNIHERRR